MKRYGEKLSDRPVLKSKQHRIPLKPGNSRCQRNWLTESCQAAAAARTKQLALDFLDNSCGEFFCRRRAAEIASDRIALP